MTFVSVAVAVNVTVSGSMCVLCCVGVCVCLGYLPTNVSCKLEHTKRRLSKSRPTFQCYPQKTKKKSKKKTKKIKQNTLQTDRYARLEDTL